MKISMGLAIAALLLSVAHADGQGVAS
ncbi:MAG: hypothetical protein JWM33_3194, partial [Caulobacteraceae bacterium]|nr:hypothetical protein [Caulobacteraceae bacterium]